jgi:hypothetical protein
MSAVFTAVSAFGVVIAVIGLLGAVWPERCTRLVAKAAKWKTTWYLAIGIRVAIGLLLLIAAGADDFHYANVFRILGALAMVGAVAVALMGQERLQQLIAWWEKRSPTLLRAGLVMTLLFGLFLVFAIWRSTPPDKPSKEDSSNHQTRNAPLVACSGRVCITSTPDM